MDPEGMLPKAAPATLVTGGHVYTANHDHDVYPDGAVLVVGDQITTVGDRSEVEDAFGALEPALQAGTRRIDAKGAMVLPGFVNPHYHEAFMYGLANEAIGRTGDRGRAPSKFSRGLDVAAMSVEFDASVGSADLLLPDEALAIARYSLWTQLIAGTTTWGDVGSLNTPRAMVEATQSLGMRGRIGNWASDGHCPAGGTAFVRTRPAQDVIDQMIDAAELCAADPTGRVGFVPVSIYTPNMSDALGAGIAALAEKYDAPVATHVAAGANEPEFIRARFGETPIRRLATLGLLTDRLIAVHCAFADSEEQDMMLEANVHICHSPSKYGTVGERTMSGNDRQIIALMRRGLDVSVSTDGEGKPMGGMPEAMAHAWLGHSEIWGDNTVVVPTDALAMGTRQGARAMRWDDRIGSLEAGKQADLVLVPTSDWRYLLSPRPLEPFFKLGGSKDVDTVMVAGRVLVEEGRTTFLDETELRDAAIEATVALCVREFGVSLDDLRAVFALHPYLSMPG